MRRAWRAIRLATLLLVAGAVVTVAIAEAVGVSGAVRMFGGTATRYLPIDRWCVTVDESRGAGWQHLIWRVWSTQDAAQRQYRDLNHLDDSWASVRGGSVRREDYMLDLGPPKLKPDLPSTVPAWASLWRSSNWRKNPNSEYPTISQPSELAVGWPFRALSMSHGPPDEAHGGLLVGSPPYGTVRALAWRPIAFGFAADAALWSVCLGTIIGAARLTIRTVRYWRKACRSCGYDTKGLPGGSACPECGAMAL